MRLLRTHSKVFLTAALAAFALTGLFAASALASPTPTTWNPAGKAKMTTTSITIKKNGGSATSCTPTGTPEGNATNSAEGVGLGTFWTGTYFGTPVYKFNCTGGTQFWFCDLASPKAEGSARMLLINKGCLSGLLPSPWGNWSMDVSEVYVPYNNGTEKTPSTTVFSDTVVGHVSGNTISITGTFEVTTSTGGLLTLN